MNAVRDILETVLIALLIAILVRAFVIERFLVDGPSMEPTLWDSQSLLVNKLAYRFSQPKRGDVVVFRYPLDPSRDYVKRCVAVGGDTVEMRLGRLYVNGLLKEEPYVRFPGLYEMKSITVPEDCIFVLGDHRTNSEDSRMFGPVKLSLVKGKAVFIIWPLKDMGAIR
ncbi:MAG: signal peptidase I [Bacillota bacterium]|jgi:signal peptidase I|nr:signal peptidase I [Candidatus Fermentithermobacillaceae bacterium]